MLAQTAVTGSLRAWAAQAEAEVERSEGEGEAQGRPVLGWAPLPVNTSVVGLAVVGTAYW